MKELKVMTWLVDGEEQGLCTLLWTGVSDDISLALMMIPDMGYVILRRDGLPLEFGDSFALDFTDRRDIIRLNRPDAGQFALALMHAVVDRSEVLLEDFVSVGRRP